MTQKDLEKKKLVNLVIQGESKNLKKIFHLPEIKEGLIEILGKQKGEEAFKALKDLTESAEKKDWLVPYRETLRFMRDLPGAGISYMEWE
jgi:hypothetical protein